MQDIPTLVSLPHPLPPGIPDEQQYIRMYCSARGLPYPLQACMHAAPGAAVPADTHSSSKYDICAAVPAALSCAAQANWSFYMALSIFRLASILAGVGARAAQGNASSASAAQVSGRSNATLQMFSRRENAQTSGATSAHALHAQVGSDAAVRSLAQRALALAGADAGQLPTTLDPKQSTAASAAGAGGGGGAVGLGPTAKVEPLLHKLRAFMEQHVYPAGDLPCLLACVAARMSAVRRRGRGVLLTQQMPAHACLILQRAC